MLVAQVALCHSFEIKNARSVTRSLVRRTAKLPRAAERSRRSHSDRIVLRGIVVRYHMLNVEHQRVRGSSLKSHRGQCRIKGVLGVLQHPGPQFWGPQLVGVVSWL